MNMGFWNSLPKPFTVLAPMEGVTDTVFRLMVAGDGRPDDFFTEFSSTDGICSPGFEKVAERLKFDKREKPIVAQVWGTKPENFYAAAKIIKDLDFDGIDINFGCPVREVMKQGGGSALIMEKNLVSELIKATREGSQDMPISVKTRIGRRSIVTEEWIGFLLEQDLAAITVHGRTAAEMSKVPANWNEIGKAVNIRNLMHKQTLIIGNGDVKTNKECHLLSEKTGVDGVMVGRGVFENIAVFRTDGRLLTLQERLDLVCTHAKLFEQTWTGKKAFVEFRKNIKMYIQGFPEAGQMRMSLMSAENAGQIEEIIQKIRSGL